MRIKNDYTFLNLLLSSIHLLGRKSKLPINYSISCQVKTYLNNTYV